MEASLIIPAHNEAPRLTAVLEPLLAARRDWEVIAVDDGSTDGTAAVAQACGGVRVLTLPANRGKGAAVWAGAAVARTPVLVLLDADLAGLRPEHVEALIAPVHEGCADMAVARFRGGRGPTDFSHVITPWVSGQRAIRRERLLTLPALAEVRHGVEALLTRAAAARRWSVREVAWTGVTHAMKEEKLGLLRGHRARWRMYGEMLRAWVHAPALTREGGEAMPAALD